jgi:stalled ribosome alternative rescue factor ArfA
MTSRKDTKFWEQFTKEKSPKALQKILDTMEFKFPTSDDISLSFWPLHSWVKVGLGHNNQVLKDNASYSLYRSPLFKTIIDNHKKIQNNQDSIVKILSSNNDFMKVLMEGEHSV